MSPASPPTNNLNDHGQKPTRSILVVDDEPVNLLVMHRLLSEVGMDVQQAENGLQALDKIFHSACRIDLVLLDIVMPDISGFDVLQRIRQEYSSTELPVIMVTASEESEQIVKAFEMDANDYLTKPVDPSVLMARLNMHLRLKESLEALKCSQERYALVARGTNDGLWDWDIRRNKIYYSPRWRSMLSISDEEPSTLSVWLDRIHPEDRQRVETEIENHLSQTTPHFEVESRIRHSDGSYRWMLCRAQAVWNEQGIAHRMAGSLTDITEGKVADALTGLPNRVLFRERLDRCISKNRRDNDFDFGLLYLDLDNFKLINDSLGHEAGDRLLVAVARRLESALRESDSFVSRLGGDEFSILIEGIRSIDDAQLVAKRIIDSVSAPISLGSGREVFASVSVGISSSWNTFDDGSDLIQAADTAMYEAKEQGKSCFRVFDPVMKEDVTKRLNLENELRRAVDNQDLFLHYQPIVEIDTSRLIGFEALVRWQHATLGNISPAEFIPIAEDNGLIVTIGQQILRLACKQLAQWIQIDHRFESLQVSVNLSNRQLGDQDLVVEVLSELKNAGLATHHLRLEVTESSIMKNPERGAIALAKFRQAGVKVAIDDFGTGYSSLSYIHQLAPDVVKIDRSFVDTLPTSTDKQTIVTAIIALAEGLGLDVVAEGIETEQQRQMLTSLGCAYAQGFLFSPPLAPEVLLQQLLQSQPTQATR
ncbi:MAG: EAL domain-containing protein [Planctomycetota bacterium]